MLHFRDIEYGDMKYGWTRQCNCGEKVHASSYSQLENNWTNHLSNKYFSDWKEKQGFSYGATYMCPIFSDDPADAAKHTKEQIILFAYKCYHHMGPKVAWGYVTDIWGKKYYPNVQFTEADFDQFKSHYINNREA